MALVWGISRNSGDCSKPQVCRFNLADLRGPGINIKKQNIKTIPSVILRCSHGWQPVVGSCFVLFVLNTANMYFLLFSVNSSSFQACHCAQGCLSLSPSVIYMPNSDFLLVPLKKLWLGSWPVAMMVSLEAPVFLRHRHNLRLSGQRFIFEMWTRNHLQNFSHPCAS